MTLAPLAAIVFTAFTLFDGAGGLKLTHLQVPRMVDVRHSAVLSCQFDLERASLYSVKWYKDELEFYRYMPDIKPQIQSFDVKGVKLNTLQCNMTTVTLHPLELNTSGTYRCEVSTEAPDFKTVVMHANMTVLGIPESDPVIEGIKAIYSVGEYVIGNCTAAKSYPRAELSWYINDQQIESWQLQPYPSHKDDDGSELEAAVLGICFQADNNHFPGRRNTMKLKCVARTFEIIKQSEIISELADLEIAQELSNSQGCLHRGYAVFSIVLFSTLLS